MPIPLVAHPAFTPLPGRTVTAEARFDAATATLDYAVAGPPPIWPAPAAPRRADGLWRTTCFELFVRGGPGPGYAEFNFAPSGEWAAYRFDARREGMRKLETAPPVIAARGTGIRVTLDLAALPRGHWQIGLTAVIEEADGSRSFWALTHPADQPDFHDPRGFALAVARPD